MNYGQNFLFLFSWMNFVCILVSVDDNSADISENNDVDISKDGGVNISEHN